MDKNILQMLMTERFKYLNEQKKIKFNGNKNQHSKNATTRST